jgi:hypothetical protein
MWALQALESPFYWILGIGSLKFLPCLSCYECPLVVDFPEVSATKQI